MDSSEIWHIEHRPWVYYLLPNFAQISNSKSPECENLVKIVIFWRIFALLWRNCT